MLDHIHPDLRNPSRDNNTYILGSIGRHNIGIACLPKGVYGTNSAATVATRIENGADVDAKDIDGGTLFAWSLGSPDTNSSYCIMSKKECWIPQCEQPSVLLFKQKTNQIPLGT